MNRYQKAIVVLLGLIGFLLGGILMWTSSISLFISERNQGEVEPKIISEQVILKTEEPPEEIPVVPPKNEDDDERVFDGNITHYCACSDCNGANAGITASGISIKNGTGLKIQLAAANWLPLGAVVEVNGIRYLIADRGGGDLNDIGRIDVFVPQGHLAAKDKGRFQAEVRVVYLPSDV